MSRVAVSPCPLRRCGLARATILRRVAATHPPDRPEWTTTLPDPDQPSAVNDELVARLHAELRDDFDEELELGLEDRMPELDGVAVPQADEGMPRSLRFRELFRLQAELGKPQDWVAANGEKVLILFEGRDSAGQGGAIKRITQRLNPRGCRVVALAAPNNRERTQWYFQRCGRHLPAADEQPVLFDRSGYNRAGVEGVMAFCDEDDVEEFFRSVPEFERMLVRSGIRLLKCGFSITDEQEHMRFLARIHDPLKQWKSESSSRHTQPRHSWV